MARTPRYYGKHPRRDPQWTHWCDLLDEADGRKWAVYEQAIGEKGWAPLKLAVHDRAPRKGNYWLNWDGTRIAATTEYAKLAQNRPKLHEALMERIHGRLTQQPASTAEPDPDGYDLI